MTYKILLVDDSLTDRALTHKILKTRQYQVIESDRPDTIDETIAQEKPDLIILDIVMPGVSGYEICRELKGAPETREIPVIFISGKKQQSDIFWGKRQGADEYLSKPIEPSELLEVVNQLLESRRDNKVHE